MKTYVVNTVEKTEKKSTEESTKGERSIGTTGIMLANCRNQGIFRECCALALSPNRVYFIFQQFSAWNNISECYGCCVLFLSIFYFIFISMAVIAKGIEFKKHGQSCWVITWACSKSIVKYWNLSVNLQGNKAFRVWQVTDGGDLSGCMPLNSF